MARIFFLAFDAAGQSTLMKKLRNAGHRLAISEPRYPAYLELVKQQVPPPEVFVVDCSYLPSHAREASGYLKGLKAFKDTPFILYNVRKEDEAKTNEKVPNVRIAAATQVEKELAALGFTTATTP